eukprot:Rmarinus@m.13679
MMTLQMGKKERRRGQGSSSWSWKNFARGLKLLQKSCNRRSTPGEEAAVVAPDRYSRKRRIQKRYERNYCGEMWQCPHDSQRLLQRFELYRTHRHFWKGA